MNLTALKELIVPIIIAFIASSGFWMYLEKIRSPKSAQTELLMGLAHDRIMYLGQKYLIRGWISHSEYENLERYLYTPYKKLGGNGTIELIMERIKTLPIKNVLDIKREDVTNDDK